MNSFMTVMGPPISLWPTSSGKTPHPRKAKKLTGMTHLGQMIERVPHTITEADGTIIKHPTFVTDNKMLFDKLDELT